MPESERRFGEPLHSGIVATCSHRLSPVSRGRPPGQDYWSIRRVRQRSLRRPRRDIRSAITVLHFRMDDVLCVLCNAYGSPRGPPPRGVPLRRQGKVPSVGMIAAAYWRLTSRAETVPRVLGVGPNCAIPPLAMSAPRRSVVPGSIIKALIDEIHC